MTDKIEKKDVDNPQRASALIRTAFKGSLATLSKVDGSPYPSLVLLAAMPDGSPIMLLSELALHTRNLHSDSRIGLLVDGTGAKSVTGESETEDPMAGDRVSLAGRICVADDPIARRRFIARHPHAADYAEFADFNFYRAEATSAHLIRGFGRIVDLAGRSLLTSLAGAEELMAAEPTLLKEFAGRNFGQSAAGKEWRLAGIDPDGFDLVAGVAAQRIVAVQRVTTVADARRFLTQAIRKQ
jgi:putative heme iron utilization protein